MLVVRLRCNGARPLLLRTAAANPALRPWRVQRHFSSPPTPPSSSPPPPSQQQTLQDAQRLLLERLALLDNTLKYGACGVRARLTRAAAGGWHMARWIGSLSAVVLVLGYVNRERLFGHVGDAASDVTRRTLDDLRVQRSAQVVARGIVYEVLNDKQALELTLGVVKNVLASDDMRQASVRLLTDLANEPSTEVILRSLSQRVLAHPETVAQVSVLVQQVVNTRETREALVTLFQAVFASPAMVQSTSVFFRSCLESPEFIDGANRLSADNVQWLFSNEALKRAAVDWINDVLSQPDLQNTAGDAAWAAVKAAMPRVLGGGRKDAHHAAAVKPAAVLDKLEKQLQ